MVENKESGTGKIETKKLDELKETAENKAAIAVAEGKVIEDKKEENLAADSTDSKKKDEAKKEKSKPAVAKVKKDDKKKEVKVELEREYIVPLRKGFMNVPHYRRAKKAVRTLREFMVRHMNVRDGDLRKIKIDKFLNNEIWFRGIKKPLHKIKVKAVKKDGIVTVSLADVPDAVKYKMAWEEKRRAASAVPDKKGATPTKQSVPLKGKKVDADKDGVDDKKEEKEDKAAGTEKAVKTAKVEAKAQKHTASGKHAAKTAPVRKVLK